jgi:hypothetical protein
MDAIARHTDNRLPVSIEASDFSCEGLIHLGGIRLSDMMNEKNPFLVIINAVVLHRLPGTAEKRIAQYTTLILRKGEIKYIVPIEERPRTAYSSDSSPMQAQIA